MLTIGGDEQRTFQRCKIHLSKILQEKCEYSKIGNPGTLLYCKDGWSITCCFRKMLILLQIRKLNLSIVLTKFQSNPWAQDQNYPGLCFIYLYITANSTGFVINILVLLINPELSFSIINFYPKSL